MEISGNLSELDDPGKGEENGTFPTLDGTTRKIQFGGLDSSRKLGRKVSPPTPPDLFISPGRIFRSRWIPTNRRQCSDRSAERIFPKLTAANCLRENQT